MRLLFWMICEVRLLNYLTFTTCIIKITRCFFICISTNLLVCKQYSKVLFFPSKRIFTDGHISALRHTCWRCVASKQYCTKKTLMWKQNRMSQGELNQHQQTKTRPRTNAETWKRRKPIDKSQLNVWGVSLLWQQWTSEQPVTKL